MAAKYMLKGLVALAMATTACSAAHAGGFSRGEADTDILFEDGVFVVRGGATYVNPQKKFKTISGSSSSDGAYSADYWIPSAAMKLDVSENFACALTYTQPFGSDAQYGSDAQSASSSGTEFKKFTTNEYGGTCDVKFGAGPGRLHFLGGVFVEDFSYHAYGNAITSGDLTLKDNGAFGYRLGIAYDIPEYAFRAQLMYRSQTDHKSDEGTFDPNFFATDFDAFSSGSLPQSLKLSVQTGIAPGWLVYGSVKWTDWSVLDTFVASIPDISATSTDYFHWRDGWTIQGGVAHAFTENVAGTVNLTWDRGVGTGADIMTDTWTVGVGTSIKCKAGEFRIGAGVSYLVSGSQSTSNDAAYNATSNGNWAYAISGSYRVSF